MSTTSETSSESESEKSCKTVYSSTSESESLQSDASGNSTKDSKQNKKICLTKSNNKRSSKDYAVKKFENLGSKLQAMRFENSEVELGGDFISGIIQADNSHEFINSCANLIDAAQAQQEHIPSVNNNQSIAIAIAINEILQTLIERLSTPILVIALLMIFVILVILVSSPAFSIFMQIFGTWTCLKMLFDGWENNQMTNAQRGIEIQRYQTGLQSHNLNIQTANNVVSTAMNLNQNKIKGIVKLAEIRRDVQKAKIEALERIHSREVKKDLKLKELQENETTKRTRMNNEMKLETSKSQSNTKKAVAKYKCDAEVKKEEIKLKKQKGYLKHKIQRKEIESQTEIAIARRRLSTEESSDSSY